jgi:hypothetical protein
MLPPISAQAEIVEAATNLRAETQHITRLYERKLAAPEELKKALLHQTFACPGGPTCWLWLPLRGVACGDP